MAGFTRHMQCRPIVLVYTRNERRNMSDEQPNNLVMPTLTRSMQRRANISPIVPGSALAEHAVFQNSLHLPQLAALAALE